jgi:hypothetical protein
MHGERRFTYPTLGVCENAEHEVTLARSKQADKKVSLLAGMLDCEFAGRLPCFPPGFPSSRPYCLLACMFACKPASRKA